RDLAAVRDQDLAQRRPPWFLANTATWPTVLPGQHCAESRSGGRWAPKPGHTGVMPGWHAPGRPARLINCAGPRSGGSWCHADTAVSMAPLACPESRVGPEFVSRCTHILNRSVISGT